MLVNLNIAQYETLQKYVQLVATVSEAFTYITESFDDFQKTEGDRLLGDVFEAFAQIAKSNDQLVQWFANEKQLMIDVNAFSNIVEQINELEDAFADVNLRQALICEKLSPAYKTWASTVQLTLQPYIQS